MCAETEERKQEGGERDGKYSAVQFLDEQAQTERLPAGTVKDKNNLGVCMSSLMKSRQCSSCSLVQLLFLLFCLLISVFIK